jgi:hypothetical protein
MFAREWRWRKLVRVIGARGHSMFLIKMGRPISTFAGLTASRVALGKNAQEIGLGAIQFREIWLYRN